MSRIIPLQRQAVQTQELGIAAVSKEKDSGNRRYRGAKEQVVITVTAAVVAISAVNVGQHFIRMVGTESMYCNAKTKLLITSIGFAAIGILMLKV